jgi:glycosyltransferase involved in cell wall biosynthesis
MGEKMKNILYLSLVDWYWIKQRPQHIAEILSKKNYKITYLSRISWLSGKKNVTYHSENENKENPYEFKENENLLIIRKKLLPKPNLFYPIKLLNDKLMQKYISKLDKSNKYDTIIVTHPLQVKYLNHSIIKDKLVIYDCMDDYKEFHGVDREEVIEGEKKLMEFSHKIIVSSENLKEKITNNYNNVSDKIYVINNGVDTSVFNLDKLNSASDVSLTNNNDKIKLGYIGTINNWLDMKTLKSTALKHSNYEFYIVGPIDLGADVSSITGIENIIFTGAKPYYSVPNILMEFDIALMPFVVTEIIKSVNPVKIYEYMALGKPVITCSYSETEKLSELLYTYKTEEEFQKHIEEALRESNDMKEKRISFAFKNSWENRVSNLIEIVERYEGKHE